MLFTQFSERLRRGQALHDAVQFPLGLKGFDEAFMTVEVGGRGCLHDGQRGCLIVIVLQHEMADIIGHRGQQGVAVVRLQRAFMDRLGGEDLDVYLMVG